MYNTQNWASILKALSNLLYSASVISLCPQSELNFDFFSLWFEKTLDTICPGMYSRALSFHLSLGAQQAPFPNRALSPFPLLGPKFVIHEKAQGPGPSRSHSGSLCFVDSAPTVHPALAVPDGSVESWRMERAQSDVLPSSQELTHPWPADSPTVSRGMGSKRLKRLGFFQHSLS